MALYDEISKLDVAEKAVAGIKGYLVELKERIDYWNEEVESVEVAYDVEKAKLEGLELQVGTLQETYDNMFQVRRLIADICSYADVEWECWPDAELQRWDLVIKSLELLKDKFKKVHDSHQFGVIRILDT